MAERVYEGGCHCGAVRFRVRARGSVVFDCNCSICTKKGFLHLIVEAADFELLSGAERLRTYRFHTKVAIHRFCERCGIHPFYTPRSHPDGVDVNARCLDGAPLADFEIRPFDGAHWEEAVEGLRSKEAD